MDYLLKPVLGSRLEETVDRLKRRLAGGRRDEPDPQALESLIRRLADAPEYLHWLRVGQGERVELVAVDDVCFFRSDRKYTAAVTRDREHLVRTSIGELAARLDPARFWRIHRGGIVNVAAIEAARRDPGSSGLSDVPATHHGRSWPYVRQRFRHRRPTWHRPCWRVGGPNGSTGILEPHSEADAGPGDDHRDTGVPVQASGCRYPSASS